MATQTKKGKIAAPKPTTSPPAPKPHHIGHRQRLRERFRRVGREGLQDYELLELILFHAAPRKDMKPLAKEMIKACGDLSAVLGASAERLKEIKGVTDNVITEIHIVTAVAEYLGQSRIMYRQAIASWDALIAYCRASMAEKQIEEFRVLFLDRQNRLIADEVVSTGTVDHTPVYPREVMKRALALSASALILVHNHPSGNPEPSKADIEMTNQLRDIGKSLGIVLHDHLIIARQNEISFKNMGLL